MNESNSKLSIIALLTVGALGMTYFLASYVVPRAMVTMTKAAPATKVSLADSWVLGERILAKADGNDLASVNVFVMDSTGKGVKGKAVTLSGAEGIENTESMSDMNGKANFKISSKIEGQFTLEATIEGITMPNKVMVTFRN